MAARAHAIAQAVATAIAGATLPVAVTPQVAWMPMLERSDMDTLACFVVPRSQAPTPLTRSVAAHDCEILVGLHQAVADETAIGALAALLEAIGDALFGRTLTVGSGQASFQSLKLEPLVDIERWNTQRQYLGILSITYRITGSISS